MTTYAQSYQSMSLDEDTLGYIALNRARIADPSAATAWPASKTMTIEKAVSELSFEDAPGSPSRALGDRIASHDLVMRARMYLRLHGVPDEEWDAVRARYRREVAENIKLAVEFRETHRLLPRSDPLAVSWLRGLHLAARRWHVANFRWIWTKMLEEGR